MIMIAIKIAVYLRDALEQDNEGISKMTVHFWCGSFIHKRRPLTLTTVTNKLKTIMN